MKYLIYIAMLIFLTATVSAVQIQQSELEFEKVLDYAEKTITITSDKPLQISLSATDPIKGWISFEPELAYVSSHDPVEFKVIVQPINAELGTYQGYVIINTISSGNELTTSVSTALDLKTTIEITDQEITQANVEEVIVEDVEQSTPLKSSIIVQNQGNIGLTSFFQINVLDTSKNVLKTAQSNSISILPLSTHTLELEIPNDLAIGKYYADIKVYAGEMLLRKHLLSFDVVEQGALPVKEESAIVVHPTTVPLSTGPIIILVWISIILYVSYKIAKNKVSKKKKK